MKSFIDDVLLKAVAELGEGILVLDPPRVLYANETFCKISGFSSDELTSFESFFDLLSVETRKTIQEKLDHHLKSGKGFVRHEGVFMAKTGEPLQLEWTIKAFLDGGDKKIVSIIRDVTEQKSLRESLRSQDLQYKLLFQSNPQPMLIYDLEDLSILAVNDEAVQKYGYTPAEFRSLKLPDLRDPKDLGELMRKVDQIRDGLSVVHEIVRHRTKSGEIRDVEIISHTIEFEGRKARVIMVDDVTERRKAEKALTESQERLRTVVTGAPVVLFAIDRNGIFTLSEGSALKRLGFAPGQVVGTSAFDLYRDNPGIVQSLKRALSGEEFSEFLETGGLVFDTHLSPVRDAQGAVVGVNGFSVDVTERRSMERVLQKRMEFEKLITSLSSHFINLPLPQIDEGIRNGIGSIGRFIGVDRVFMYVVQKEKSPNPAFEWYSEGVDPLSDEVSGISLDSFPWFSEKLGQGEAIQLVSLEELPAEASAEREFLGRRGVRSIVAVPLATAGTLIGFLTFSTTRAAKTWTPEDLALFKITGEMFAGALMRKRNEQALLESEGKFRVLFHNAFDSIFLFAIRPDGSPGPILEANDVACVKLGYARSELLGKTFQELFIQDETGDIPKHLQKLIQQDHLSFEKHQVAKNGLKIPVEINAHLFEWGGQRLVQAIARDITDRKRAEETIRRQAYYDPLTNLPNRMLFKDRLEQAMKQAHRNRQMLGVIVLDLDRFKNINETLGHILGDKLLVAVAERLLEVLHESETIARFGGDEFTLLLPQINSVEEATQHAQKIIELLAAPFKVSNHELHLTTSIGISFYPEDGENAELLLKNAETAMYRAKEQGRNNYQLYASVMNVSAFKQLLMENSLRRALDREEFVVYYQPQYEIKTQKLVGAEALVRWKHPDLGLVFPTEFIGLAEETGLIVPIGEWVIRNVCAKNKEWQEAGCEKVCIGVNLSARQFQQRNLVASISQILHDTGLDPKWLGLEITESIAMKNADFTISALNELKKMKIKLSLDDFGTGYSSLSYLKRFPLEALKIDRSFVRDITTDPNDAAIVNAVVALAHSLKLTVVAEGVETETQLEFLRNNHCDAVQGYIFSHPLSEDNFLKELRAQAKKI
ncbi:MAG TPA: EAL domain-containing protein [bacterium]|nr:EAL domain-containing protein [bacterium]